MCMYICMRVCVCLCMHMCMCMCVGVCQLEVGCQYQQSCMHPSHFVHEWIDSFAQTCEMICGCDFRVEGHVETG